MKKTLIFSCMMLIAIFFGYSQTQTSAVINFDKKVHDYGEIYQNDNGNCEFKFTNSGNEPLVLSSVRSSCGCTVPQWPKEPILPGQSGVIKVAYDTKRIGIISKDIIVLSNATESQVTLSIKGNVQKKPDEVIPFKNTDNGLSPTQN